MKRLRAARQPMTFCTPFRSRMGPIRVMAETFSGLGSMPHWEMMKPKSMPRGTPNTHFSRLSFTPLAQRQSNAILRSATRLSAFLDFTTMSSTYASTVKCVEHTSLVCGSGVSKAKGHRNVAVHAEMGDKRSRELVGFFHLDLVITGICIKEG